MASQKQYAGDRSTLIQAGRDIHVGLTVSEGRQIALDVFKANALELAGLAKDLFEARGTEFIERYLQELQRRRPDAIKSLAQPDMQYALFSAQREAAKSGDEDLYELLTDMLVDRAAEENRSLKRIVLDEALVVAPKLTVHETSLLSISFLLTKSSSHSTSLETLRTYIQETLIPFVEDLPDSSSSFLHLLYTGCGSTNDEALITLAGSLYYENLHLFCEGLTAEEILSISPDAIGTRLVIPCLSDPALYQLASVPANVQEIAALAEECGLPETEVEELVTYQYGRLSLSGGGQIGTGVAELFPELTEAITRWDHSGATRMELTSVGIAIALANIRRKTGRELDLADWLT